MEAAVPEPRLPPEVSGRQAQDVDGDWFKPRSPAPKGAGNFHLAVGHCSSKVHKPEVYQGRLSTGADTGF